MSSVHTHLTLGRVSNLPTVWTNTLSAAVLSGATFSLWALLCLIVGLSLYYVAGMYLNDALDSEIDARERPNRPIPAGLITRTRVMVCVVLLMISASVALILARFLTGLPLVSGHIGWWVSALLLIAMIVAYDAHHKSNAYSPLLMALCRVLLLTTGSYLLSDALPAPVLIGAVLLFSHLVGLTYAARFESGGTLVRLWPLGCLLLPLIAGISQLGIQPWVAVPLLLLGAVVACSLYWIRRNLPSDIPRAVGLLIAGICLLDALLIGTVGEWAHSTLAMLCFFVTVVLQRRIKGT